MESLYILIPIALLLAGGAIAAFLWAVRTRQFDDLEMEGRRLLFDDEADPPSSRSPQKPGNDSDDRSENKAAEEPDA